MDRRQRRPGKPPNSNHIRRKAISKAQKKKNKKRKQKQATGFLSGIKDYFFGFFTPSYEDSFDDPNLEECSFESWPEDPPPEKKEKHDDEEKKE